MKFKWVETQSEVKEGARYKGVGVVPKEKVSDIFLKSFRRYNCQRQYPVIPKELCQRQDNRMYQERAELLNT